MIGPLVLSVFNLCGVFPASSFLRLLWFIPPETLFIWPYLKLQTLHQENVILAYYFRNPAASLVPARE